MRWKKEKKKKRQWTSDLSLRRQGKLCSLGATRVHHPLCHSSPQCLALPSHKTPVKTSCSPFYGCQMVGRPPCLWTCLPSLVKPVDLGNIKTAVYEKALEQNTQTSCRWNNPNAISSPKEPFLQDKGWICEPWLWAGEAQMRLLDLWVHFLIFSLLIIICKAWVCSSANISPRNGEAKHSAWIQVKAEPQSGPVIRSVLMQQLKTNTLKIHPPQPEGEKSWRRKV